MTMAIRLVDPMRQLESARTTLLSLAQFTDGIHAGEVTVLDEAVAIIEQYQDSITSGTFSQKGATKPEQEGTYTPDNPYAVGTIWHTSWGYDQTNVEFYVVVRETAASVWLKPLGAVAEGGRLYPVEAVVMPPVIGAEMHRKGKHGVYLTLDSVRHAWPYKGGGCYETFAAGGAGH